MASSASSSVLLMLILCLLAIARSDPDPLSQLCVADNNSKVFVDGVVCKDPSTVTADDYLSSVLTTPPNTSNVFNVDVTLVDVTAFPGLNTQGLTLARLAFGPHGVNPPHNHPRSSEVIYLVSGTLQAGFVSGTTLFQKTVHVGEMFVFPRGLVHFQRNPSKDKPALAIAALGSQNPGRTDMVPSILGTQPALPPEVLEVSLQVSKKEVEHLREQVAKTTSPLGGAAPPAPAHAEL